MGSQSTPLAYRVAEHGPRWMSLGRGCAGQGPRWAGADAVPGRTRCHGADVLRMPGAPPHTITASTITLRARAPPQRDTHWLAARSLRLSCAVVMLALHARLSGAVVVLTPHARLSGAVVMLTLHARLARCAHWRCYCTVIVQLLYTLLYSYCTVMVYSYGDPMAVVRRSKRAKASTSAL